MKTRSNVEGDAHPEQRLFRSLLIPAHLGVPDRIYAFIQQTRGPPWVSIRLKHLIVKTACVVSVKRHKKSARSHCWRTPSSWYIIVPGSLEIKMSVWSSQSRCSSHLTLLHYGIEVPIWRNRQRTN